MKVISQANETVLTILKRFLKTDFSGRMMKYCVETATEDGVLLFNLMTREMVLLTEEEYSRVTELDYLRQRWFVVPEQLQENIGAVRNTAFITEELALIDQISL